MHTTHNTFAAYGLHRGTWRSQSPHHAHAASLPLCLWQLAVWPSTRLRLHCYTRRPSVYVLRAGVAWSKLKSSHLHLNPRQALAFLHTSAASCGRAVVGSWRGGEWRWQDADGQQQGRTGSTKQGNHRYPAFPVLHTTYYLVLVLVRALRFSSGKSQVVPSAARLHPFGRPCPRYSTSRSCSDSSGLVVAQLTDALIHCANAEENRGTPSQLCRRCSERLVET